MIAVTDYDVTGETFRFCKMIAVTDYDVASLII